MVCEFEKIGETLSEIKHGSCSMRSEFMEKFDKYKNEDVVKQYKTKAIASNN